MNVGKAIYLWVRAVQLSLMRLPLINITIRYDIIPLLYWRTTLSKYNGSHEYILR